MSYRGIPTAIDCKRGGLVYDKNIDTLETSDMIHPTRNLDLSRGGREKRGGTSRVNSGNQLESGVGIYGGFQFRLQSGVTKILTATATPKIWSDYVTDITNAGSWNTANKVVSFVAVEDRAYIANAFNIPQIWDGSAGTTSDIANPNTDWTGINQPKAFTRHGYGAAQRMWAWGVANKLRKVYYSVLIDGSGQKGQDFLNAGSGVVAIDIDDGYGIVGCKRFGNRLIAQGKEESYITHDTDPDPVNWGSYKTQWVGGVANHRLSILTPWGLMCMAEDGDIYLVKTVDAYGDYKEMSIAQPAYIDRWIRDYVNLAEINNFFGIYNPADRAVYFFMQYGGASYINMALKYYGDRGPREGWMPDDNQAYDSGFKSRCAFKVKPQTGSKAIYTGGWADGYVYDFNKLNKNDNANGYYGGYIVPNTALGDSTVEKKFRDGQIVTQEEGVYSIFVKHSVDDIPLDTAEIDLLGSGYTYGNSDSKYDTATYGGVTLIDGTYDIKERGKRYQAEVYNTEPNADFFISRHIINAKPLARRKKE